MQKLTTDQFIAKAQAVHGLGSYDYSLVRYKSNKSKVRITCPIHGEFEQTPHVHLRGSICRACSDLAQTLDIERFLAEARATHGSKYDYSQSVCVGSKSKVKIICPQHGEFEQRAYVHMAGSGCSKCAIAVSVELRRLPVAKFINKAQAMHGQRYDYSRVVYSGAFSKVKIICPQHGEFEQEAKAHKNGSGCPKCGKESMSIAQALGAAEFISKAESIHGIGRYDYSQVLYKSNKSKVKIICPQHGEFEQTPNSHITGSKGSGSACPGCVRQTTSDRLRLDTDEFITQSRAVHGFRYDYSKTDYRRGSLKVIIICSQHGEFKQQAQSHKKGVGCPTCANKERAKGDGLCWAKRALGRPAILYLLKIFNEQEEFYKVGVTYLSVEKRFADKRTLAGYDYEVLATHTSANAAAVYDWEQSLLESFSHLKYWPKKTFGGETECFSSADEILKIFPL